MTKELLCPSAPLEVGSKLYGIVGKDRRTHYLPFITKVDNELLERISKKDSPEKRFRFASNCVSAKCKNWEEKRCVLAKIAGGLSSEAASRSINCSIRDSCRWWVQEGSRACQQCQYVVRDVAQ